MGRPGFDPTDPDSLGFADPPVANPPAPGVEAIWVVERRKYLEFLGVDETLPVYLREGLRRTDIAYTNNIEEAAQFASREAAAEWMRERFITGDAFEVHEHRMIEMPNSTLKDGWFYRNRRGDPLGPMDERVPGTFLDQYGTVYAANGQQLNHTHDSTGNIDLLSASTSERT